MKIRSSGKCIFCGGGNLTKEHIWPKWMGPYLPKYADNRRVEFGMSPRSAVSPYSQERPGYTWTKKIRVVCQSCNNGWMSVCENTAKPILLPLMTGQRHTLTIDSMGILSRWIALKMMVCEQTQPEDVVTPFKDRESFKDSLGIPKHLKIWIAKCGVDGWESSYRRHSAKIKKVDLNNPSAKMPTNQNIHSIALGIGDLFILGVYTTADEFLDNVVLAPSEAVSQLYPVENSIEWPPKKSLSVEEATKHASILESVFSSAAFKKTDP